MPVKYLLGEPRLVSVVGMMHGLLWVGLIFALLIEYQKKKLVGQDAVLLLIASTFPLGMIWADRRIGVLEKTFST
jgi:integral membrane protein